jgi:hypothetical protein
MRGPVAVIRLNRPAKRNALNDALILGLRNPKPRPSCCMAKASTFARAWT